MACSSPSGPPVAAQLELLIAPAGATSGLPLAVQPVVRIESSSGQPIATAIDAVTASISSGSGTLVGTTTVNAVAGIATFTNLRVDGPGTHTLHFTAVGLDAVTAPAVNVTQVAASLEVDRAPTGTYNGYEFEVQPRIEVLDHAGIRLASGTVTIAASKASGSGTVGGTLTATATAGLATFAGLKVTGSGAHELRYSVSPANTVTVDGAAIDVHPGLKVIDLSLGARHACAISIGGYMYCWGNNDYGKAGQAPLVAGGSIPYPRRIVGNETYVGVSLGTEFSCGIVTDGRGFCWGYNAQNQLGGSTALSELAPVAIAGTTTFVSMRSGAAHTCGLTAAGVAHCWGHNANEELGVGHDNARLGPAPVSGSATFSTLDVGPFSTCGLSSGVLYCWGPLALPATPPADGTPQIEVGGLSYTAIAVGHLHKCGLVAGDGWYCWGTNNANQFGDGTGVASGTPKKIDELTSLVSLDTYGTQRSCGLTAAGAAYCWGSNLAGQLGDGSTTDRPTPTAVAGGLTFTRVVLGAVMTCGITTAQEVYCWGLNDDHSVGDGTTTERHVPTRVGPP